MRAHGWRRNLIAIAATTAIAAAIGVAVWRDPEPHPPSGRPLHQHGRRARRFRRASARREDRNRDTSTAARAFGARRDALRRALPRSRPMPARSSSRQASSATAMCSSPPRTPAVPRWPTAPTCRSRARRCRSSSTMSTGRWTSSTARSGPAGANRTGALSKLIATGACQPERQRRRSRRQPRWPRPHAEYARQPAATTCSARSPTCSASSPRWRRAIRQVGSVQPAARRRQSRTGRTGRRTWPPRCAAWPPRSPTSPASFATTATS